VWSARARLPGGRAGHRLVISATGFFPDGKWNALADGMRTEGQAEEMVDGLTRASSSTSCARFRLREVPPAPVPG
jgi:hypothetical protein